MKSNIKRAIIGLIFLTCVVVVVNILSKEVEGNMKKREIQIGRELRIIREGIIIGIEGYTTYRNEELGFSFEYPKNWWPPEERTYGSEINIIIYGPRQPKKPPSSLRIQVIPSKERGDEYKNLEEYTQYNISRESFKNTKIISDIKTIFKNLQAREITISNQYNYPLRSVKQIPVTLVKKWITVEKDGYFYDLQYGAIKEEHPKYIEAYEHAKKTFKFLK